MQITWEIEMMREFWLSAKPFEIIVKMYTRLLQCHLELNDCHHVCLRSRSNLQPTWQFLVFLGLTGFATQTVLAEKYIIKYKLY